MIYNSISKYHINNNYFNKDYIIFNNITYTQFIPKFIPTFIPGIYTHNQRFNLDLII